jgi:signal peptidase I
VRANTLTPAALFCALIFATGCQSAPAATRLVAPTFTYVAHTGSMAPGIRGGEGVAITDCLISDVQRGDLIVSWWAAKELNVLHRVIKVRNTATGIGLVTKGDANPVRDTFMTTVENFIGCARIITIQ